MRAMRRSDRSVQDPAQIDQIIRSCDCCRLALSTPTAPYIVPLNFGYCRQPEGPVFYFHGAPEGRKLELIWANEKAGFELDTDHQLHGGETACSHSFRFQSVVGWGAIGIVKDPEEKREALRQILLHHTGKEDWQFDNQALDQVAVFRLDVKELSCKQHK